MIHEILKKQKRFGELLVESGKISPVGVESALKEQKILEKRKTRTDTDSIRISSEKLDMLINLVGEIVVTQAHIDHLTENGAASFLSAPLKQMNRLTGDLRNLALDMRMLPVGTLFNRLVQTPGTRSGSGTGQGSCHGGGGRADRTG